jgi:hypothetical protein
MAPHRPTGGITAAQDRVRRRAAARLAKPHASVGAHPPRGTGAPGPHAPIPGTADLAAARAAARLAKPHAPVGAHPPGDAGVPGPHAPIPGAAGPAAAARADCPPKHRRRPLAAARTMSGTYSAANWVNDRHVRTQTQRARVLTAAVKLGLYLPREVAARLAAVPAELRAPVHPSQIPYLEIATKTPGGGGPDVPGRCAAGAFSAQRVRAAELAAARAEQAALAPWRAAVAAARLAKREALAARRAARMGKHDKDPMPMERLPGTGLGARAAGIAAATEAGSAGTAARMGKHDKDPVARLPGAGLGARATGIAAVTEAGDAGTAAGLVSARQESGPGDGRTVEVGRAAALAAKRRGGLRRFRHKLHEQWHRWWNGGGRRHPGRAAQPRGAPVLEEPATAQAPGPEGNRMNQSKARGFALGPHQGALPLGTPPRAAALGTLPLCLGRGRGTGAGPGGRHHAGDGRRDGNRPARPRSPSRAPNTMDGSQRLRLWWGSRGQSPLAGFRAEP